MDFRTIGCLAISVWNAVQQWKFRLLSHRNVGASRASAWKQMSCGFTDCMQLPGDLIESQDLTSRIRSTYEDQRWKGPMPNIKVRFFLRLSMSLNVDLWRDKLVPASHCRSKIVYIPHFWQEWIFILPHLYDSKLKHQANKGHPTGEILRHAAFTHKEVGPFHLRGMKKSSSGTPFHPSN